MVGSAVLSRRKRIAAQAAVLDRSTRSAAVMGGIPSRIRAASVAAAAAVVVVVAVPSSAASVTFLQPVVPFFSPLSHASHIHRDMTGLSPRATAPAPQQYQ